MDKSTFQKELLPYFDNNEIEAIAIYLNEYTGTHDFVSFSARYHKLVEDFNNNEVTWVDKNMEINRIRESLLSIIYSDEIPEKSVNIDMQILFYKKKKRILLDIETNDNSLLGLLKQRILNTPIKEKEKKEWARELLSSYKKRIDHKIKEKYQIQLRLKKCNVGTSPDYVEKYFVKISQEDNLNQFDSIVTVFDRYKQSILLIGEPGAGKTALLLELAIEKIEAFLEDSECYFPIILDLSSWSEDIGEFAAWIEKALVHTGFSKAISKELLKEHSLMLLLDGLDEISNLSSRNKCLHDIDIFQNEYNDTPTPIVICSRKIEYQEISANAPVRASFEVQPLTFAQIESELKRKETVGSQNLLSEFKTNLALQKSLDTPFTLNTALEVFASSHSNIPKLNLPSEYTHYIRNSFIINKINKVGSPYTQEDSEKYLSYLAKKMRENRMVSFRLDDLQVSYLSSELTFEITYFIAYILISFCLLVLSFRCVYPLFVSLLLSSTISFVLIFVINIFITKIRYVPNEEFVFSLLNIKKTGYTFFSELGYLIEKLDFSRLFWMAFRMPELILGIVGLFILGFPFLLVLLTFWVFEGGFTYKTFFSPTSAYSLFMVEIKRELIFIIVYSIVIEFSICIFLGISFFTNHGLALVPIIGLVSVIKIPQITLFFHFILSSTLALWKIYLYRFSFVDALPLKRAINHHPS